MKSRIVYYSRTGTTRLLAEALAARTLGELAEITCTRYPTGFWGWLRAGRDSSRGWQPPIDYDRASDRPDCLIIGSPVWSGTLAAPVRSYLAQLADAPERVGLFLTSDDPPPHDKARNDTAALLGRAPDGWLTLQGADVRAARHMDEVEDFLRDLTHPLA